MQGASELVLHLSVGGLDCQQERFRLLHAQAATWPGHLVLIGGDIAFIPNGATSLPERVVILVPHQDESLQRILKPMDSVTNVGGFNEALFIGDTLVEGADPATGNAPSSGLPAGLAKATPTVKWVAINVAGPHRYRPVLRMLADLDAYVAANPGKKLPSRAVVSLGSGDVSRQTPLYTFERALDTLLARLSAGGVEHVVVVGVIPEPWRERQCEPYQERVENVVKQHKVSGVDLFHMWTRDQNTEWTKRFAPDGEKSDVAGPVPNSATLNEIIQLILSRQK